MVLSLAAGTLIFPCPAARAQNIFNCTTFYSTTGNACSITWPGPPNDQPFFAASDAGGSVVSGAIDFVPSGAGHNGNGMFYQTAVNIRAFTATFTFVPNGQNFAFVVQNDSPTFSSGAGGESGFYQAFTTNPGPGLVSKLFALQFDSYDQLTAGASGFTYSSASIYQTLQPPYVPGVNGSGQLPGYTVDKTSTYPIPLNSPAGSRGTTTRHTYSATVTYSGNMLTLKLYDVTAGGSCPGARCFSQTWNGVYIPGIVGATTAYVGFTAGVGENTIAPLLVKSFSYRVNSPSSLTSLAAWNAGSIRNIGTASAASPK